jgi:hypothetical protein
VQAHQSDRCCERSTQSPSESGAENESFASFMLKMISIIFPRQAQDKPTIQKRETCVRFLSFSSSSYSGEWPHVAVDTLAYTYTRPCPRVTRPRSNVIIRLCAMVRQSPVLSFLNAFPLLLLLFLLLLLLLLRHFTQDHFTKTGSGHTYEKCRQRAPGFGRSATTQRL